MCASEVAERHQRVVDLDGGHSARKRGSSLHHDRGSARVHRVRRKLMCIEALSAERNEEIARLDDARVCHDAANAFP